MDETESVWFPNFVFNQLTYKRLRFQNFPLGYIPSFPPLKGRDEGEIEGKRESVIISLLHSIDHSKKLTAILLYTAKQLYTLS